MQQLFKMYYYWSIHKTQYTITVNAKIIAKFLLLKKMCQGYNRINLNSHFDFFEFLLNRIVLYMATIKITLINACNYF